MVAPRVKHSIWNHFFSIRHYWIFSWPTIKKCLVCSHASFRPLCTYIFLQLLVCSEWCIFLIIIKGSGAPVKRQRLIPTQQGELFPNPLSLYLSLSIKLVRCAILSHHLLDNCWHFQGPITPPCGITWYVVQRETHYTPCGPITLSRASYSVVSLPSGLLFSLLIWGYCYLPCSFVPTRRTPRALLRRPLLYMFFVAGDYVLITAVLN
jgi:hypothetical protein